MLFQVANLEYGVETVLIVYLHLLSLLPLPQIFLTIFFAIFLTVGLATQFFQIDLIISAIHDNFWIRLNKYLKSRELLSMLVVTLGFLLCLPLLSRASLPLLHLAELHLAILRYLPLLPLLSPLTSSPVWPLALEMLLVLGCYGWSSLLTNLQEMTSLSLPRWLALPLLTISCSILFLGLCCQVS